MVVFKGTTKTVIACSILAALPTQQEISDAMTDPTTTLLEYLSKFGLQTENDSIRERIRVLIQAPIETEAVRRIGAERYERSSERFPNATATAKGPTRRGWAK